MATNKGYFTGGLKKGSGLAPTRDAYARPDSRVEYQLFGSEYFSAADVKIYFGDIWVDEAISLAFQLQEEVMPIYGYNSYTYDSIARGKRLVQGSFAINLTTVGYLQSIIENANAIFYALEQGEKSGIISPEYYEEMKLSDILTKLGKTSFDQMADEYEKAIWGVDDAASEQLSYSDRSYFRQDDLGFDIRIQYGAVSQTANYVDGRFYNNTKTEAPNTTVEVLNGVQLTGMNRTISTQDQGAPLVEMYSFIARDLNGISFAHLKRMLNGGSNGSFGSAQELDTTYRKLQYGVIE